MEEGEKRRRETDGVWGGTRKGEGEQPSRTPLPAPCTLSFGGHRAAGQLHAGRRGWVSGTREPQGTREHATVSQILPPSLP